MLTRSALALAGALLAGGILYADDLKSGPQVGEGISGAFYPDWITGKHAGDSICPV